MGDKALTGVYANHQPLDSSPQQGKQQSQDKVNHIHLRRYEHIVSPAKSRGQGSQRRSSCLLRASYSICPETLTVFEIPLSHQLDVDALFPSLTEQKENLYMSLVLCQEKLCNAAPASNSEMSEK